MNTRLLRPADVFVQLVDDLVIRVRVVDGIDPRERIEDVAMIRGNGNRALRPGTADAKLEDLRELRSQVRIAYLQQLRIIVLREDAQLLLAGSVDPAIVRRDHAERAAERVAQLEIRENLEVVVRVARVVVDVLVR